MEIKEEIVKYLISKYNAKGLVLYGSRAESFHTELSDWDIYIFTDKSEFEIEDYCEYRKFKRQTLEISTCSTIDASNPLFCLRTSMHPIGVSEVLYDDLNGLVKKIVERSAREYERGPARCTKRRHQLMLKVLRKFLQKAQSRPNQKEVVFFAASQFFIYAIRYWFELNMKWPLPIYRALPVIGQNSLIYAEELMVLYSSKKSEIKIESMKKIFSLVESEWT